MTQLTLDIALCSCGAPAVASSITGTGHVCSACNTAEWGRALARNKDPYFRAMGLRLLADVETHRSES